MSQPSVVVNTSQTVNGFWSLASHGIGCNAVSGSLGPSTIYRFRRMKSATSSTGKVPYHARPPTDWWSRYGQMRFPVYQITGQRTSGPCTGQGYSANPDTWGFTPGLVGINEPYVVGVRNEAITRCLNQIKGDGGQLGLAFAERKRTEDLFVDTTEAIWDDTRKFAKAHPSEWADVLASDRNPKYIRKKNTWLRTGESPIVNFGRKFSRRYLAMVYGWKPLMQDVHNAMLQVDRLQKQNSYTFIKTGKFSVPGTSFQITATSVNGFTATMTVDRTDRCLVKVEYILVTDVLSALTSMGLTNPFSIAWERVPWSFVLDWFIPIGNWFNTFDATLGKQFSSGFVTETFLLRNSNYTSTNPTVSGYSLSKTLIGGVPHYSYISTNREKLNSFPLPAFPAFRNPCSPQRIANALALGIGLLTRKR
jgi:hypothetical protein